MKSYRKLGINIVAGLTIGLLSCTAAFAQGPAADPNSQPQPASVSSPDAPPAPPQQGSPTSASADQGWHFDIAPYVWIPGVNGTVGAYGHDASVHATGSDLFSNFNGGLSGSFEADKGRLVIPIDFMWTRVATTQGIPLNDLSQTSVRAEMTQTIFTPKIGYRIIDMDHFKVDALLDCATGTKVRP